MLHSLAEVVQYAADHGKPGMAAWISRSEVKVLGMFERIPPSKAAGWILEMISKHGSKNRIAVLFTDIPNLFKVKWYPMGLPIPWDWYRGNPEDTKASILNGTR